MSPNSVWPQAGVNLCAVVSLGEAAVMISLSRSGIYRLINAGDFVQPIQLSPRRVGFRVDDINAWLLARSVARTSEGAR
jgi:predicted DNA-binding transcriptional regulator AlpA